MCIVAGKAADGEACAVWTAPLPIGTLRTSRRFYTISPLSFHTVFHTEKRLPFSVIQGFCPVSTPPIIYQPKKEKDKSL